MKEHRSFDELLQKVSRFYGNFEQLARNNKKFKHRIVKKSTKALVFVSSIEWLMLSN